MTFNFFNSIKACTCQGIEKKTQGTRFFSEFVFYNSPSRDVEWQKQESRDFGNVEIVELLLIVTLNYYS